MESHTHQPDPSFLARAGELGGLIAAYPWERTPLGAIERWPASLRTTVALILGSPVPIVTLWGGDGIMIYNDAYSIVAGGRHPQLLGSKVREGWPEVADFNDNVMKVGLAGGTLAYRDQELTLFRIGRAEQVWMNLDYSPIADEQGEVIGVMAIVVETTATVRAEHRLSGEHERLRHMFDQAPGFVAMLEGPDHIFTMANEAYYRLVGRRDIIGRRVRDALPDTVSQGFLRLLDQVHESKEPYVGRSTPVLLEAEGGALEERYLDFVYQPIFDHDGGITGIFVQGNDVTEERRGEEALRQREAQLSAFISQATGGFAQVDLTGLFTLVNDRFCEIAGRSREELLTLTMQQITHPEDLPGNVSLFERAVAAGTPYILEKRYIRPDGSIVWVNNSVSVIRKADGEPYGVLAITIDVTERRRLEEDLRHLNETLEERVRLRSEELERVHAQLRQSQKLEAIGQLTGGVAHDFNNLLTPIFGNLDLLRRRQVGSERDQRLIGAALESAERAKTLVQRLLAFARRQPLQTGAIDIAGLLEGMSELVSSTVGPQIRLVVDAEPDLAPARSDANQLEMAILNLAVNARDAMPDGGMLTIRATLEQVGAGHGSGLAADDYVRLTIADTGVGMDEVTLAKAVEPFFSTKGLGKGTGLGLSMVHGLMSQLGGAMQISSARGHGTTIALFLPVAAERGDGEAVEPVPAGWAGARAGTVLLVDDEDLVRASTAEVLRDLGYSVLEAASAREAMDHLANNAVDYVVTDHLMPEVSGLELARTIASRADAPPVLVVSGYADLDEISADFPRLAKPFRQDELASALASLRRG